MDFRMAVLFLSYALHVKTSQLNHLTIPGCEFSGWIEKDYALYGCPNSKFPNFRFTYQRGLLQIKCEKSNNLQHFSELNFGIFNDIETLQFINCNALKEFSLDEFCKLVNISMAILVNLDLRLNNFTTIPTDAFQNLTQITNLKLESNGLEKMNRFSLNNLKSLRSLTVYNEPLEEIEPETFDNLTSLRGIEFINVTVRRLPENLFRYGQSLLKIQLSKLNIIELPRGLFSNMYSLGNVIFTNNNVANIPEDTFSGSVLLNGIDLSYNQLQQLPEGLFDGLSMLKILILTSNKLKIIPNFLFRDLRELQILSLRDNQLKIITSNQFTGLTSLIKLYLNFNMVKVIEPESMMPFAKSLEIVDFNSNRIDFSEYQLTNQQSPFANCTKLRIIDLGYNRISMILRDWTTMQTLETLNLQSNEIPKLTDIDVNFSALSKLKVDLSQNKIHSIEFNVDRLASKTWNIRSMRYTAIDITNNPIICDCNLYNFKRFEEKKLPRSSIELVTFIKKPLICQGPDDMNGLNVADVESKNLVCENVNTTTKAVCPYPCSCKFSPYKNADIVDCSNRNLTEAPYQLFPSREGVSINLDLTGNKLTGLPKKNQLNYELVKEMYASHNQINAVDETNILPDLKVFTLDHNNLRSLTETTIKALRHASIGRLILNNNFWKCDCESEALFFFLKKHSKLTQTDIICYTNNKSFSKLKFSDVCSRSRKIIIISVLLGCSSAITFAIVTIFYYKYRTEIRNCLHVHQICLCLLPKEDSEEEKLYDAFFSFAEEDKQFVMSQLVDKLESGPHPYRLCLQHRDLSEDDPIQNQIKSSIENSTMTVIVLSKNYVRSVWGAVEYHTSLKQVLLETKARVIVIIYGDLPTDNELDDVLKSYLQSDMDLRWGSKWFWDKLWYVLPYRRRIMRLQKIEQLATTSGDNNDNTSIPLESFVINERFDGVQRISLGSTTTSSRESNLQVSERSEINIRRNNYDYDYHQRYRRLNIHVIQ